MLSKRRAGNSSLKIKPDKHHSRILIEIMTSDGLERAKKVIQDFGADIVEVKQLPSRQTLIELNVKDMREVALKMIEHGILVIRGINAVSS